MPAQALKQEEEKTEIHVCKIELLLGGADASDRMAVYHAISKGISIAAVASYVASVPVLKNGRFLQVLTGASERTVRRRLKQANASLNPEQSARVVRFAQLLNQAATVLGDAEDAGLWMSKPATGLAGYRPIDLITNNAYGAELVEELLTRLEYGVYQ